MTLENALYQAFLHMYHTDHANAAIHCGTVRYSPLTFRLAEQIQDVMRAKDPDSGPSRTVYADVWTVLMDLGQYREDAGR